MPVPLSQPRPFDVDDLFFSMTDARGAIVTANAVFSRVAGYSPAELVGAPHNKIRHPDMPRAVFRLLWRYLKEGRPIAAMVKNLAADGRYYWVVATAMPCPSGYLSVRFKPTTELLDVVAEGYRALRGLESEIEAHGTRNDAMDASATALDSWLRDLAFDDYDDFMQTLLYKELTSWQQLRQESDLANVRSGSAYAPMAAGCLRIIKFVDEAFAHQRDFVSLSEDLAAEAQSFRAFARRLRLNATNTVLAAGKLGSSGAPLSVVAESVGQLADAMTFAVDQVNQGVVAAQSVLSQVTSYASIAKVQGEVVARFIADLAENEAAERAAHAGSPEASLGNLIAALDSNVTALFQGLSAVGGELARSRSALKELQQLLRALEILHVRGQIESSQVSDERVGLHLAEITDGVRQVIDEVRTLIGAVGAALSLSDDALAQEHVVRGALIALDQAAKNAAGGDGGPTFPKL